MKSEKKSLILSTLASLLVGILGITFSIITNSGVILLDGLFNISYFVTAIFTLRILSIIKRPDDEKFPFGYGYFEALINAVKGLLILGVSLIAFFEALMSIFADGREISSEPAIFYASIASVVGLVVTLMLYRSYKANKSPLVKADYQNWILNTIISSTVLVAFVTTWFLERTSFTDMLSYVDPFLTALVASLSIGIPVRMTWNALMGLLNKAPSFETTIKLEKAINTALTGLSIKKTYVRMVQPGRVPYVLIHVLLKGDENSLTIESLDSLREKILKSVLKLHNPVVIDVLFTANQKFAEPTSGFSEV
ncbi:MAG: cation diffusion facilitator family transporter [Bacteroidales bacterium]|nr:cation diffusion facilitator family transporter [Bacteroidales bacterium]